MAFPRRSAALLAVLSLLGTSRLQAERVFAAREAVDAAGASAGHGRRRSVFAAVLLGVAAPRVHATPEERLEGKDAERFRSLDVDGDQQLTQQEFEAKLLGVPSGTAAIQHMAIFSAADLDGDGLLSLPEYVFAGFLTAETFERNMMVQLAHRLPPNFIEDIDDMFLRLRRRVPGGITMDQVQRAVCEFVGIDAEQLIGEDREKLRDFFAIADVIEDGVLNLNELDFLHFIVRESMVDGALQPAADYFEQRLEDRVSGLFEMCDANGDGLIDGDEAVKSLIGSFAESALEKTLFRELVGNAFQSADADRNGVLDRSEAGRFIMDFDGRA